MPKGGAERTQGSINYGQARGQQLGENLRTGTLGPQLDMFRNYYQNAANQGISDYGNIMGQYQNLAQTGGYSPQDIAAMRARSMSPVRSAYASAQQGVENARSLQGGYSPGYGVLQARMARQQGTAMSEAATNTEAALAQLRAQGKQAGMAGMAGMYGATPGMASMFGNQMLNATGQLSNATQNEANQPLQWAQMQAQQGMMPGKWQQGFQNVLGAANNIAGLVYPWAMGGSGALRGVSGGGMANSSPSYATSIYNSGNWGQPGVR